MQVQQAIALLSKLDPDSEIAFTYWGEEFFAENLQIDIENTDVLRDVINYADSESEWQVMSEELLENAELYVRDHI